MRELRAEEYFSHDCLLPMIPLMDGGMELLEETERKIYESNDPKKIDNLIILTIFTGLRDRELSRKLWERRRDIMIESPVYEMIIDEGN